MNKENSTNEETRKKRIDMNDYEILYRMTINEGVRYNSISQRGPESIIKDIYRNGTIGGHSL
ncbi:hypothetical protein M0R72_04095 [Candidatus Pacearchaeota archaeon]|jgi:hypothetical protein|nr:hypothetical protein [Candidatus Pacearchaeota archaeon]